ncbi:MAG TPA: acyltransferase [Gemmatimonadaceae bacterium]
MNGSGTEHPAGEGHRRHVPALDGVRGIAILLVVLYHAGVARHGWVGVDLFFVLSGFLITGVLVRAKGYPGYYRNFFARRALRIVPACYVFAAIVMLVIPPLRGDAPATGQLPVWAFLTNIPIARAGWGAVPNGVQHLWSVAVEEQFYLVWPVFVLACSIRRLRQVCVAGIAGALLFRVALHLSGGAPLASYVLVPARMDALLLGGWLALAPVGAVRRAPRANIVAGALAALVTAAILHGRDPHSALVETIGYTMIAVTAAALVAAASADGAVARILSWRPLRLGGKYSYAAYLGHAEVINNLELHTSLRGWPLAIAAIAVTFALAALSWRILEAPVLRLKRYFPEPAAANGDHRAARAPVEGGATITPSEGLAGYR